MTPRLHPNDLAELARLVAEQVSAMAAPSEWLTVAEYAERYRVSRTNVYANADELGAVRIGGTLRLPATPPKPHELRVQTVAPEAPKPEPAPRRRPRARATSELLPIGGEQR